MTYRMQDGVIVGNIVNKNKSKNPIEKFLVANFNKTILNLIEKVSPTYIHEVGAGEGFLAKIIIDKYPVKFRLSDISKELIEENKFKFSDHVTLVQRSIYDLRADEDSSDLIICCEVLEHLEYPQEALKKLLALNTKYYIFSVPNEPLWCSLNFLRGKYLNNFGNTPGHIQHWSSYKFTKMLEEAGFNIVEKNQPIPWIIVLASKNT